MDVRRLLARWGLRPSKGLGQHFLADEAILARIAEAAELGPADVVLEVGAGLGTLTAELAKRAGRVVALELDERLMGPLASAMAAYPNVELVQGDILALDPAALVGPGGGHYKVVANLPYYITSAVLRHLLEATPRPQRIVVTLQREVAEAIVAGPGRRGLLAVSVQFYGQPRLLFRIKPGSFFPAPAVESAVLCIDVYPTPPLQVDEAAFFRAARAGFSQPRKQLRNSLAAGLGCRPDEAAALLARADVDARRRAETLSLAEWARVAQALAAVEGESIAP